VLIIIGIVGIAIPRRGLWLVGRRVVHAADPLAAGARVE